MSSLPADSGRLDVDEDFAGPRLLDRSFLHLYPVVGGDLECWIAIFQKIGNAGVAGVLDMGVFAVGTDAVLVVLNYRGGHDYGGTTRDVQETMMEGGEKKSLEKGSGQRCKGSSIPTPQKSTRSASTNL